MAKLILLLSLVSIPSVFSQTCKFNPETRDFSIRYKGKLFTLDINKHKKTKTTTAPITTALRVIVDKNITTIIDPTIDPYTDCVNACLDHIYSRLNKCEVLCSGVTATPNITPTTITTTSQTTSTTTRPATSPTTSPTTTGWGC